MISHLCFLSSCDKRCTPQHPPFYDWDGVSQTVISISVARITYYIKLYLALFCFLLWAMFLVSYLRNLVPGMVIHTFNPSTQKAMERRSWVWGQPGLYSKTLSQTKNLYLLQGHKIFFPVSSSRNCIGLWPFWVF
jgi:hypothetical protein